MIMEGYNIPDSTFYMLKDSVYGEGCSIAPPEIEAKRASELFAGKKVIIFGLPGAFTPTCSNSQLPGFEELFQDFEAKGVDEIWCTSVNDAFVMDAWATLSGAKNVKMLPDGNADFARALGTSVYKSNLGFGERSWRYTMLVEDMMIKRVWSEDNQMSYDPKDPYEKSDPYEVIKAL
jgi:peroxiredoxin